MRKEVKLGMFIGGGLVALLVVYLLVAPPSNNKKGAQLADGGAGTNIADMTAPGDVPTDNSAAAKPTDGASGAPAAPETRGIVAEPIKPDVPKGDITAKHAPTPDNTADPKTGTPTVKGTPREPVKAPERTEKKERVALGNTSEAPEPKLYFDPNGAWGGGLSTDG